MIIKFGKKNPPTCKRVKSDEKSRGERPKEAKGGVKKQMKEKIGYRNVFPKKVVLKCLLKIF